MSPDTETETSVTVKGVSRTATGDGVVDFGDRVALRGTSALQRERREPLRLLDGSRQHDVAVRTMTRSGSGRRATGGAAAAPAGPTAPGWRRMPRPLRLIRNHARLFGSLVVGLVAVAVNSLVLPEIMLVTRLLIGWDVAIVLYLALTVAVISRFDLAVVRKRAAIHDEGGVTILLLTVVASVASLVAIVAELGSVTGQQSRELYFAHALVTIVLSWTFIHVIFAIHYAHKYYGDGGKSGGLEFPDDDRPDYWDFVYFSFVIGMTFQVSDVQVTSKPLRHVVVLHGIVSFVFNVAILALVVNLGASFFNAAAPSPTR